MLLKSELERQSKENENLVPLLDKNKNLELKIASLEAEKQAQQEKIVWMSNAQETLKTLFQSLASEVLESNSKNILSQVTFQFQSLFENLKTDWSLKKEEIKNIVSPIEKELQSLDNQIQNLEKKREGAYSALSSHLNQLAEAYKELHQSAIKLEQSLKSPLVRGSWGEYQLQRLVEMAGMEEHVSYLNQPLTEDKRADMIISIPGNRKIFVDAKTPMRAYLEAISAENETLRKEKIKEHLSAVKERIRDLGKKEYARTQAEAFEYIIMFLPSEGLLSLAFEADPDIFQYGLERNVLLASPINFLALLKAIALGWQQQRMTQEVEKISEEIKKLYDYFVELLTTFIKLRKALETTIDLFNKASTICQEKIIPSSRKIQSCGALSKNIPDVYPIEMTTLKNIESA
ncbi:DNA recombination protein RmuC [Methylacidiphilum caldifontis]|uniref:DNA recombination protein RmuC n=1 Tax=Methylacidiphilum caldifontis TaxID=2795386 RepID=UPI001F5E1211|nr:DNA recombination protein RmuC [Methylacidiphilum caldifontis]